MTTDAAHRLLPEQPARDWAKTDDPWFWRHGRDQYVAGHAFKPDTARSRPAYQEGWDAAAAVPELAAARAEMPAPVRLFTSDDLGIPARVLYREANYDGPH